MNDETLSRRTILFVNIAHAFDHFILLIYPTAVIAIAIERGLDYATLISLSTGAFVAFGLFSLPMGWIADRIGRRNLMAIFFFGYGLSCIALATADSFIAFVIGLFVLGVFSAIYHPVGSTMLVSHASRLGHSLGWNGVWGNLGAASASGVTALIAATFGWRMAFVAPGLACLIAGMAFVALVPGDGDEASRARASQPPIRVSRPAVLLAMFALAIIAGGVTFNISTIALPKVIDERLAGDLPLVLTGSLATLVFLIGAAMQLAIGRLIDWVSLPVLFVSLSVMQPLGLGVAAMSNDAPLLAGMAMAMAAIYGQVVVNDAMIARYVPLEWRSRAYSIRYFLGFSVAGFAAPMIALLHAQGGFSAVLTMTAAFGAVVFLSALAFLTLAHGSAPTDPVAGE